jgi:magnesium chelatase family protein
MSFARVYSAQTSLLKPTLISVEVDLSKGLNAFSVVGLPDKAVEEARDRIAAAIKNTGFKSPKQKNQKTTIALAPADIKKEGPFFDIAMALGYLLASDEIDFDTEGKIFLGELALDGSVRPIKGALPLAQFAKEIGLKEIYVPHENTLEAGLIDGIAVHGVATLGDLVAHLEGIPERVLKPVPQTKLKYTPPSFLVDFADVKGQESAKRGLEIAAAGGHNVAMYGPPGTGKTLLAKAFTGILPPLSFEDSLEVTGIHSVSGTLSGGLITHPPFRSPHHSSSHVALVGGGAVPRPGEITLAHKGVLFLDEFPEFDRRVIEALRQPLEDRIVSVSRARGSAQFPANVILVTAMNPCQCGNWGSEKICTCQPNQLLNYQRKLSGPIIDRIDMWLEVGKVDYKKLSDNELSGEVSDTVRARVSKAREKQLKRFAKTTINLNGDMGVRELKNLIPLSIEVKELLNNMAKTYELSARSYHRMIKLARTIADLSGGENEHINTNHIIEAFSYRPKQIFV